MVTLWQERTQPQTAAIEMLPVVGYEGLYSVTACGKVYSHRSKRYLTTQVSGRYHAVHLSDKYSHERRVNVHRIVAEAYLPNPEGLPHVLHKDDDKTDNSAGNLYWGTPKQNRQDSVVNGVHGYSKRTACARGHEYTEANTYNSKAGRVCRACKTIYHRRAKERS